MAQWHDASGSLQPADNSKDLESCGFLAIVCHPLERPSINCSMLSITSTSTRCRTVGGSLAIDRWLHEDDDYGLSNASPCR